MSVKLRSVKVDKYKVHLTSVRDSTTFLSIRMFSPILCICSFTLLLYVINIA